MPFFILFFFAFLNNVVAFVCASWSRPSIYFLIQVTVTLWSQYKLSQDMCTPRPVQHRAKTARMFSLYLCGRHTHRENMQKCRFSVIGLRVYILNDFCQIHRNRKKIATLLKEINPRDHINCNSVCLHMKSLLTKGVTYCIKNPN